MRRRCTFVTWGVWLVAACLWAAGSVQAADRPGLDWSAWRELPVLHGGRIQPLDSVARQAVAAICGRESPTLDLVDAGLDVGIDSPALAKARALFPGDKPRKFAPDELVFSWLVEPEAWEEVPFLIAEHDELRRWLDVPVTNSKGEHLRYVAPNQIKKADKFFERLRTLDEQQRMARAEGRTFELSGADKKAEELVRAFNRWQTLTLGPDLDPLGRRSFDGRWSKVADAWVQLAPNIQVFRQLGNEAGLGQSIDQCMRSLQTLLDLSEQRAVGLKEAETATVALVEAAETLAGDFDRFRRKLVSDPPDWSETQLKAARSLLDELADGTRQLADRARALAHVLYDNDEGLRVVPALDAAALEGQRDPEQMDQPWLDLQAVLEASLEVLAGDATVDQYPRRELEAVRNAFAKAAEVYKERSAPNRGEAFAVAMRTLGRDLRALGEAIEPLRTALPIKDRDEWLLAYTKYPAAGATGREVRYNRVQPFMWSWVFSLLALWCFALSFGAVRKPMFWLGLFVLVGGLAWTTYGFYLRVLITGFAPVTNMYETVIYVPYVVSVLGIWFLLLPLMWPGLAAAWRMTALPGLGGRKVSEDDSPYWIDDRTMSAVQWTLTLPRLALMTVVFLALTNWRYAAGNNNLINLLPRAGIGGSGYSFNDLQTWAVGLCVLAIAMWFVPRTLLTGLVGLVTVPWSAAKKLLPPMESLYARRPFALSATFVAFVGTFVAYWAPIPGKTVSPLMPILRDNVWLTIHVLTIVSSYAAGALAWGLGNIALFYYLFGKYRDPLVPHDLPAGHRPAGHDPLAPLELHPQSRRPPEACHALAGYNYRTIQVAVILLIAGTILGGLWADVSWGRFWGWDPKEVWALISGLVYLAILHGRYAGWFGNFGLAAGTVAGMTAIMFSWYGVNFVLGAGLHSYGFGTGGQMEVGLVVLANWIFLGLAAGRYHRETSVLVKPQEDMDGGSRARECVPARR